jgi:hypothetical protein
MSVLEINKRIMLNLNFTKKKLKLIILSPEDGFVGTLLCFQFRLKQEIFGQAYVISDTILCTVFSLWNSSSLVHRTKQFTGMKSFLSGLIFAQLVKELPLFYAEQSFLLWSQTSTTGTCLVPDKHCSHSIPSIHSSQVAQTPKKFHSLCFSYDQCVLRSSSISSLSVSSP